MRGVRRADDLARGRAGLGNSSDVGLALLFGQFGELGDVARPIRRPWPWVLVTHIKIGLDQDSGGGGHRLGRRQKNARRGYPARSKSAPGTPERILAGRLPRTIPPTRRAFTATNAKLMP
jgi:hypothetical protein